MSKEPHQTDDDLDLLGREPRVDREGLAHLLLGHWPEVRLASRALAGTPEFQGIPGLSKEEHRARVLSQLGLLVQNGQVHRAFPKIFGGLDDHGGMLAGFEELIAADPSLQIKSGVQWGLFTSAILHLGTADHHARYLPDALSLKTPGIYAMTETGHGSDVSALGTTAEYDPATHEFVIHTPFRGAWKDYLGNAALHGRAAVVFAQLITQDVNHGVHAFYVPIRDEKGNFYPGIGGEDDGLKGGLNGIDNGRLHFNEVRVPRVNLLNRYGDVSEDGTYTSPIASPGRRFFTMLGTLVQGRVSLDGSCVNASKMALQIAVTYGDQRRQFAGHAGQETVLLDYQRHQRRLIPRIATTYAQAFAHEVLLKKFDDVFSGVDDTDESRQDLETLAAALKPLSTWFALDTLQEAREACGGQGFLAENRLVGLRADLDIYVTFEGDNNVLLQLVAKRLLTDFSKKFAKPGVTDLAKYALEQAAERTINGSGLRRLGQNVSDRGSTARAVSALRDPATQHELLADRVETGVAHLVTALRDAKKAGRAEEAFNEHQSELIELAIAHGELLQWEAFSDALDKVQHAETKRVLTWLRDLFGLSLLEKNMAWYLIHGRLSAQRAQAVTRYVDRLIARLRPHAQDLVDVFGYGPQHLRAEIASGAEQARQDEARAYFADSSRRFPPKESVDKKPKAKKPAAQ
jgi:acyl-CoA oxidase